MSLPCPATSSASSREFLRVVPDVPLHVSTRALAPPRALRQSCVDCVALHCDVRFDVAIGGRQAHVDRPTWVTTGLTREQLVKRYGTGMVARVFDKATVIRLGELA